MERTSPSAAMPTASKSGSGRPQAAESAARLPSVTIRAFRHEEPVQRRLECLAHEWAEPGGGAGVNLDIVRAAVQARL